MTYHDITVSTLPDDTWPLERLRRLENFGRSLASTSYLFRPTRVEEIEELLALARSRGYQVTPRGAHRSYGDAALNAGGVVLDMRRMNRILSWDPVRGVLQAEPGATIDQIWQHTLEDGWWLPVVPGTAAPTLGGCLAMNIHGKNNYQAGPIGDHVLAFETLLPNGKRMTCTPEENADLFYAMIGGLGMLGIFTSITVKMKRVYAGDLWVSAWAVENMGRMLNDIDSRKSTSDYIVGWVDTTAGGAGRGRGQIHGADYLTPEEEPYPVRSLSPEYQVLPDTLLGLVPKSIVWRLMRPVMNRPGLWGVNTAKYWASRTISHNQRYRQSFVAFNFLLDYVPDWERAYGKGGLIQYQSFVPTAAAQDVFGEMLRISQKRGLPSFLGVVKRHKPDAFLLSHAVDGFSLALDFSVPQRNKEALIEMTAHFNQIVLEAGGRFYFAKDSTMTPEVVDRFLGEETIRRFMDLKRSVDPAFTLQSDLFRRCFANHLRV